MPNIFSTSESASDSSSSSWSRSWGCQSLAITGLGLASLLAWRGVCGSWRVYIYVCVCYVSICVCVCVYLYLIVRHSTCEMYLCVCNLVAANYWLSQAWDWLLCWPDEVCVVADVYACMHVSMYVCMYV